MGGRGVYSYSAGAAMEDSAYALEFGKIGIDITYTPQKKKSAKLVTQKTGTY